MRRFTAPVLLSLIATSLTALGCHHASRSKLEPVDSKVGVPAGWLHESASLSATIVPVLLEDADLVPPRTLLNPEADEIWELGLAEATQIALKNSDVIRTFEANSVIASPTTIYDPAISETLVQDALSRFDTNWNTAMFWSRNDLIPRPNPVQGNRFILNGDNAQFSSSLSKLFATGGTANVAFNTTYQLSPHFDDFGPDGKPGGGDDIHVHPSQQYAPNLELGLRQPLLKGSGTDFNRAPVVIARLQSDQSMWELKQAILQQVRGVEEAYWRLYTALGAVRALEDVIPELQRLLKYQEDRERLGAVSAEQLYEAQTRLAEFRQQRIVALSAVLQSEMNLRNLLGLPANDGRRIVPRDEPLTAPVVVDWQSVLQASVDNRPDIVRQRLQIRIRQLELLRANNALQPQLDVEGLWRINGLDTELDSAIDVLTDNKFTDWQLGLTFSVPLGFRQASAQVQAAELNIVKDQAFLRQFVHSTAYQLNEIVRELESSIQEYFVAEQRLESNLRWVEITRIQAMPEFVMVGGRQGEEGELARRQNVYIQALQSYRTVRIETYSLLARYNTALARLEEVKGTLLDAYNIRMIDDPVARVRYGDCRLPPVARLDRPAELKN